MTWDVTPEIAVFLKWEDEFGFHLAVFKGLFICHVGWVSLAITHPRFGEDR